MDNENNTSRISDKMKALIVVGIVSVAIIINQVYYNPNKVMPENKVSEMKDPANSDTLITDIQAQKDALNRQKLLKDLQVKTSSDLILDTKISDSESLSVAPPTVVSNGKGKISYSISLNGTDKLNTISWNGNKFDLGKQIPNDPIYLSTSFVSIFIKEQNRHSSEAYKPISSSMNPSFLAYMNNPDLEPLSGKTMTSMSFTVQDSQLVIDYILFDNITGTDSENYYDLHVYLTYTDSKWIITDMDMGDGINGL